MASVWLLILALTTSVHAADSTPLPVYKGPGLVSETSPHFDLELNYLKQEFDAGLASARAKVTQAPNDPDLHWMIARFIFEIGERYERTDKTVNKMDMYQEMVEWCDKGLALAPGHPQLLFFRGIARARIGTTRGVLASLFMAKDIERMWAQVAMSDYDYATEDRSEHLPCDAMLTLGIFYRMVPEWWIVQALAGTRGDLGKSVDLLHAADKCSPNRINVIKEVGVAEVCYGQKRKDPIKLQHGIATLQRALTTPVRIHTDVTDVKHTKMILADLDLACEYSRDGQQDLDREKLDEESAKGN